jgi:steroid 5-alpha reductase family enzyme
MWKTVLILLFTIIVIPFFAFTFDEPLSKVQHAAFTDLVRVYLIVAGLCFLVSLLSGNYSQVDKLWSLIPIVYVWMVAVQSGYEERVVLMAVLVSIWGLRLTYNFSRRGGYSIKFWTGEEDYRWAVLRAKPEFAAKWKWTLFNLFFISFYQMGLILMFTLPALKSMDGSPLRWIDYAIAALFLGFVILETIADQQQWNFHQEKARLKDLGGDLPEIYKKGFVSTGLWALTRHPNYASEQAIWIVFYFFSVSATGMWLNWSVMGALLLVLLFWGSSNFSESISAGKYAEYQVYKLKVPRFVPYKINRSSKALE